jgi:methyl-accepting chemotaxis protein
MLTYFSRIPIFRRLFLAFFLAAVIPDSILVAMNIVYTRVLLTHGIKTDQLSLFLIITLLAVLVSTGVVVLLGWFVNSTITHPLNRLVTLARQIRQGDTSARAVTRGNDEIAIVSQSINGMLDTIVDLMQQAQSQRDYLQHQIEKLVREVSGVGEGNLNIQAEVTTETLGILADAFNYMVEELNTLVIQVKCVSFEVESATTTTQHQMFHLVTDADKQRQQIESATKTIAAMAEMSLGVSKQTHVLASAAKDARQAAYQGRETVQQTLAGIELIVTHVQLVTRHIGVLGERSRTIDEVVKAAGDLAQKITRLALDASIQAATAGGTQQGGFGPIVADMRRLSEETKGLVSTIAKEMQGVRSDIETVVVSVQEAKRETTIGAERIQQTGNTLSAIFGLVEQQAQQIEHIHQAISQLFQSSQEIQQTMTTIFQETHQSSESIRSVAQKIRHIAELTQHLRNSVDVFKLKENAQMSKRQRRLIGIRTERKSVDAHLG